MRFVSRPALHYVSPREHAERRKKPPVLQESGKRVAAHRKEQIEVVTIKLKIDEQLGDRIDRRKLKDIKDLKATIVIDDFVIRGIEQFAGYAAGPRVVGIEGRLVEIDRRMLVD